MRWLRSWPARQPYGRPHVVDRLERLVIDDYDYTPLGEIDDDAIIIEWVYLTLEVASERE